jgi:hypothetical protein
MGMISGEMLTSLAQGTVVHKIKQHSLAHFQASRRLLFSQHPDQEQLYFIP